MRLSLEVDDNLQVARWLADDGVDFLHISLWDVTRMSAKHPASHPLTLARAAVPTDVALIATGKNWTHRDAEAVLALGADLVALGRSAILNPDWPKQVEIKVPPITRAELADRAVSPTFAGYLTRWKNLVAD